MELVRALFNKFKPALAKAFIWSLEPIQISYFQCYEDFYLTNLSLKWHRQNGCADNMKIPCRYCWYYSLSIIDAIGQTLAQKDFDSYYYLHRNFVCSAVYLLVDRRNFVGTRSVLDLPRFLVDTKLNAFANLHFA